MLDKLEKYYRDGLLMKQVHPIHDLTIWNYSPKVQYDRLWDDVTLLCRGLITNSKGEIVARPFSKFFNYEEYLEIAPHTIPNEPFEVFEKMDGSLGILFNYKGEWIIATRGSFTSDQAIKGKEILDSYRLDKHATYKNGINKKFTYLFETIYPENRIVVNYNEEKLVLLGAIYTGHPLPPNVNTSFKVGDEMPYRDLKIVAKFIGCELVKRYDGIEDYSSLKSMISNDTEGFVIRFKNGFRMKIKGDEYRRLHRILTNVSNRDIWEYLKNGKPLDDVLEKVPDEFYNWVRKTINDFENKHAEILGQVIEDFWEIESDMINENYELTMSGMDLMSEREYSKKYAEYAKTKKYPHLLFSYRKEILNPINTTNKIWDMLYPDYQKPFKKDDE